LDIYFFKNTWKTMLKNLGLITSVLFGLQILTTDNLFMPWLMNFYKLKHEWNKSNIERKYEFLKFVLQMGLM
jgi:hypothetical protein